MTRTAVQFVFPVLRLLACVALFCAPVAATAQQDMQSDRFLLIRDDLSQSIIQIGSLDQQKLHYLDAERGWRSIAIDDCLALIRPGAHATYASAGSVHLADGQILPGAALSSTDPDREALAWDHLWIGRMELPLGAVASVSFAPHMQPPPAQAGDVVLLTNGDQLTGIVVEIGDPVVLDVQDDESSTEINIPVERVAAVSLVSRPRTSAGRRVWFVDGTIINVRRLLIGDDSYVRLAANPAGNTLLQAECPLSEVMAVFFQTGALLPLATLEPQSIEGPDDRYTLPAPKLLKSDALGNLSPIELRGPLTVRYTLPRGVKRFAATAVLPAESRTWGDYELIIECDGREVHRQHLNAADPTASINTEIDGSEFTITLEPGARGPIQDRLVLRQAMFLIDDN